MKVEVKVEEVMGAFGRGGGDGDGGEGGAGER